MKDLFRMAAAVAALLFAAPAIADGANPKPATPKESPGTWVATSDYPAEALRTMAQGKVQFLLQVTAEGSVSACTIKNSSGSPILDSATCTLMMQRARFNPATDPNGSPTVGNLGQQHALDSARCHSAAAAKHSHHDGSGGH